MKYIILGRSGLRVSEICLGAMTFGEEQGSGAPEPVCRQIYDRFRQAGGNFIDTANIYTRGTSEKMLAEFIGPERECIVLASKYSMTTRADDPNAGGNQRKNMVQALDASLRRLGTDYLDLYWVHGWDRFTPVDEVMRGLDHMVRAGKVLHVGVSNMPAWVVAESNVLARERNMTPYTALQLQYNLVERGIEADFFDLAESQDMAVTAWGPLASGLLTGKFDRDADPNKQAGARLTTAPWGARTLRDQNLEVAEGLSRMAAEIGIRPAQLALAWLLHRPQGRVIPILGARSVEQFDENLQCLDVALDAAQVAALDELSEPAHAYPTSLLNNDFFKSLIYGDLAGKISR